MLFDHHGKHASPAAATPAALIDKSVMSRKVLSTPQKGISVSLRTKRAPLLQINCGTHCDF